jgi:Domain of unknown function (DUF397)
VTRSAESSLPGAQWRKAKASGSQGGCVEVATNLPGIVAVRDTKDRDKSPHVYTDHEWRCFLDGVRNGEFDL